MSFEILDEKRYHIFSCGIVDTYANENINFTSLLEKN